jgi:COMM domain containing 5
MNKIFRLPSDYVNDFSALVYSKRRESIEHKLLSACPQRISLKSLNWAINVSISTSSLSRTLEPSVLFKMHLSNDEIISFEMTLNKFHELRFNVTLVLKEMDDILNRQMFRLLDQ